MNPHSRLSATFLRNHPAAAARVLEGFPSASVAKILVTTSPVIAEHVIEQFTPGFAASCFLSIEPPAAGRIFTRLLPDYQVLLLRQLDGDKRELLLGELQPDQAASMRNLLPYPDGTAGALMEAPLASVPEELSIRDALRRIKRIQRGMKFYVYATNAKGQLTGVLTLHELINAQPATSISQVMHRDVASLSSSDSVQNVITNPYWHEYHALPVTDEDNALLGVIRQKSMRRFRDRSTQTGAISGGLEIFITVAELFSVTASHLLAASISTGTSLTQGDPHG